MFLEEFKNQPKESSFDADILFSHKMKELGIKLGVQVIDVPIRTLTDKDELQGLPKSWNESR